MRLYRAKSYRSKKRPHLKFVVNYRQNGKRARSFFETEKAAKSFAQLKNNELLIGETEGAKQLAAFGKTMAGAFRFGRLDPTGDASSSKVVSMAGAATK
jgi:hypothetical protein